MRKNLAPFLTAIAVIVAGVVAFMAFESYTLDINAHLEPVLSVNPHGDWELGTVYPETTRNTKLFVGLSNSAKADPNFIAVRYTISCQPKGLSESSRGFAVLNGFSTVPVEPIEPIIRNLCPNITVTEQVTGDVLCTSICQILVRTLTVASQQDGYLVAIVFPDCIGAHQKEPGVKEIDCNLDPATGKYLGVDLGARISVQVTDIDQTEKCITRKDGTELPGCVKDGTPTPTPEEPTITPTPDEPTVTPTPGDGLKHPAGETREFKKTGTAPNGAEFDCAYHITFQGVSIELNGFKWSYFVESVPGQDGPRCGLSHWSFALCQKAQDSFVKADPPASQTTVETGDLKGLKWDGTSENGDFVSGKFTFTLDQNLDVNRDPGVDILFKFDGINLLPGDVEGPECPNAD